MFIIHQVEVIWALNIVEIRKKDMENIELIRKIDQLEESVNYLTLLVKGLAREDKPKWVSKNKAYKKYGRASVDNWIKSGLVKVYQPGGPGGYTKIKLSELDYASTMVQGIKTRISIR